MERNPENIEARGLSELKPVFFKLSTARALGAIAIKGALEAELTTHRI
jgi:hypothetical protein